MNTMNVHPILNWSLISERLTEKLRFITTTCHGNIRLSFGLKMLTSGISPVIIEWSTAKHISVGGISSVLLVSRGTKTNNGRTRYGMAILVRNLLFVGVGLSITFRITLISKLLVKFQRFETIVFSGFTLKCFRTAGTLIITLWIALLIR